MKHIKSNLILLLLSVFVLTVGSCTILGSVIGDSVRRSYRSIERIPLDTVVSLEPQTPVVVYQKGQRPREGIFYRVVPDAGGDQNRNTLIMTARIPGSSALTTISIGFFEIDSVFTVDSKKMHRKQTFAHSWEISHIPKKSHVIITQKDGKVIKGRFWGMVVDDQKAGTGQILVRTYFSGRKIVIVPVNEVMSVQIQKASTGYAKKGALIGLATDGTFAIVGIGVLFRFVPFINH